MNAELILLQFFLRTLGWLVLSVGAIALLVMIGAGFIVVLDAWRSAPPRRGLVRR
jgi:hypothetical protein